MRFEEFRQSYRPKPKPLVTTNISRQMGLYVRPISMTEMNEWVSRLSKVEGVDEVSADTMVDFLSAVLCDQNGELVFNTEEGRDFLAGKNGSGLAMSDLSEIQDVVLEAFGIKKK